MLFDLLRGTLVQSYRPGLVAPALRAELVLARLRRSYRWQGERLQTEAGLRFSLRAFEGREPVVFSSLLTPAELFHALGLVPFNLEAAGAGAASLGLAPEVLAAADRAWAPADSCSILRAALGVARLGMVPRPLAAVCTSCLCDATPRAFAEVARLSGAPFRLLDVPYVATDEGVAYLAGQFEALGRDLAEMAGRQLSPARLAEAVRLSNEARRHLLGIAAVRQGHPGIFPAADALGFLYPISTLVGSPQGAAVFGAYHDELAALAQRPRPEARGPRLLWLHLLPYYHHDLIQAVEEAGARVVGDEMGQVYWPEMDPGRPYEGLARRCIGHFYNGPLERRIERLLDLARRHGIDGAVHLSQHGCRQSWGALQVVRDALAQVGVPLLELEADCIDARSQGQGQLRTRLQAFAEMLGPPGLPGGGQGERSEA